MERIRIRPVVAALCCAAGLLALIRCGSSSNGNGTPDAGGNPDAGATGVAVRFASLDFPQETGATQPAVLPYGAGLLAVDLATGKPAGFMITSGLVSPTVAHVHGAARGTPGGVIIPLTKGTIRTLTTGELTLWVVPDGATPLTTAQIADFQAGKLYYNAHTTANPNGEIRGQLDHQGTVKLAALDATQEGLSATTFPGFGGGILAVDADGKAAGFLITTGLATKTNAHVHDQPRGTPGGVILPLTGPTPQTPGDSDLWVVPDDGSINAAQVADFGAGKLYYNAHTTVNPNGEIRGQLDHQGTLRLASLDATQEGLSATTFPAVGAGVLAVDASGKAAGFMVTAGLVSPTIAHVHDGARGAPAGVIVPLTFATDAPVIGIVPDQQPALSAGQATDFGEGKLYYNAHTTANPTGEIRGQLDRP